MSFYEKLKQEHMDRDKLGILKHHRRQKYRCKCGACIETAPGR